MRRGFVDSLLGSVDSLLLVVTLATSACRPSDVRAAGSTAPPAAPPLRPSDDSSASAAATARPDTTGVPPADPILASPPRVELPHPEAAPSEGFSVRVGATSRLEAVGASGRWIAVCEPTTEGEDVFFSRLGDAANAERVDALLAASSSGRYVVLLVGGRTRLVDATTGKSLDLTPLAPSLEFDALPDHRSFALSDDDRTLAVLEKGDRSLRLVPLGAATFDAPFDVTKVPAVALPEAAWRIEYQTNRLVVRSPESGRPWPAQKRREPARRCRERSHFSAHSALSEPNAAFKLQSHLLSTDQKRVEPAPGFVFALGARWLRREADGRLLLVEGRVQKQVASSRCGARVLHADAERQLFVVACEEYRPVPAPAEPRPASKKPTPPRLRFPLYLVGPGYVLDLEAETMRTGVDVPPSAPRRYASLRPNAGAAWVDLERRQMVRQSADTFVLVEHAGGLLFKRGARVSRVVAGREEAFDLAIPALSPQLFRGEFFAVPGRAGSWLDGVWVTPSGSELISLDPSGVLVTRSTSNRSVSSSGAAPEPGAPAPTAPETRLHVQVLRAASSSTKPSSPSNSTKPSSTVAPSTQPPSSTAAPSVQPPPSTAAPSTQRLTPPRDPP